MLTKTLTSREEQIARCAATGLRNKEIATTFFISERRLRTTCGAFFTRPDSKTA
jgi:DNA-binding CsgD family transcriptional regulator